MESVADLVGDLVRILMGNLMGRSARGLVECCVQHRHGKLLPVSVDRIVSWNFESVGGQCRKYGN